MNSEKKELNATQDDIVELRIEFYGPDAAGEKLRLLSVMEDLPELAISQGVVDGVSEGQDLDEVDPATVFSETTDSSNLSIFFAKEDDAGRLVEKLVAKLSIATPIESGWKYTFRRIRNTAWQDAWQGEFKPFSTSRFDVVPFSTIADFHTTKERHLIAIEPGEAFGTGQHATTLACLIALEKIWDIRDSSNQFMNGFLDVGTGTGILGIAAAKVGMTDIHGTEIDPAAVAIATKNIEINSVKMTLDETAMVPTNQTYDIVVSNVLTEALVPLIPDLVKATSKNGRLLLAGYIENDSDRFAGLVKNHGGELCFDINVRGWVCQVFTKK